MGEELKNEFPGSEKFEPITVDKIMRKLDAPDYPDYIAALLKQVTAWISRPHVIDGMVLSYWDVLNEFPENFFDRIQWVNKYAALLPAETPPALQPEAVVVSLGEADLTGAMRLAVDYGMIFSKRACRRVWIVTDCWIPFDVLEYGDHIRAMMENGISIRLLVSTIWGWMELPISAIAKMNIPGGGYDDGRGRSHRRGDDD